MLVCDKICASRTIEALVFVARGECSIIQIMRVHELHGWDVSDLPPENQASCS